MKYLTLDTFNDGTCKHKDWIADAVCSSKFSHLIKFIVEEETKDFLNQYQPERSKREDFVKLDVNIFDRALKRAHREGAWEQEDYDQMCELVQFYKDAVL